MYFKTNGIKRVVRVITTINDAYTSLLIADTESPTFAKINPTSPRGTIAVPIINLDRVLSFHKTKPESILPMTATSKRDEVSIQIKEDDQLTACKSRDSPIATKKMGVNK